MKLTPLDIRHKEFRRAMRGYSDEDVDIFLDEVADEFERLFQENIEARERIEHLVEQIRHFEALKETLQKTLVSAQQQADEMKSNARKEAELIIRDAEIKGRDLVGESYNEKQKVQQSLTKLKQVEEDFRFKFRSLLEAHINLLAEDEMSEDRRRFRSIVSDVESDTGEQTAVAPLVLEEAPPWAAQVPTASAPETFESRLRDEGKAEDEKAGDGAGDYVGVKSGGYDGNPFADLEREAALLSEEEDAPVFDAGAYERAPGLDPDEPLAKPRIEIRSGAGATTPVFEEGEEADEAEAEPDDVSVRRYRFGSKEKEEGDDPGFFDGPEDRDFHW